MEEQKKQDVASHSLESEFVTYEQALALKELGFDEECMAGYDKEDNTLYIAYLINAGVQFNSHYYTKAPLKQQVFRWFREKYRLDSYVRHEAPDVEAYYELVINEDVIDFIYDNHPEAENACIDKLIELTKTK
jgi:hypothetical protein